MSTLAPGIFTGPERGTTARKYDPMDPGGGPKTAVNVGATERLVSGVVGGAMAAAGIGLAARRQTVTSGLGGLALAVVGGALINRGVTGHCAFYQSVGVTSERPGRNRPSAWSNPFSRGVVFTRSVAIHRPPEAVYAFYRDFRNLPRVMHALDRVEPLDQEGRRTRWVAKAPAIAGSEVEWVARMTADEPNRLIAWESEKGAVVTTRGRVQFLPDPHPVGGGTLLKVRFEYHPMGGAIASTFAKLMGQAPEQQVREDLRRLKAYLEAGEIPTTEGQPQGRCG